MTNFEWAHYNDKAERIDKFTDKVHEAATRAAQAVYDKHRETLINMIRQSLLPAHDLRLVWGHGKFKGRLIDAVVINDEKIIMTNHEFIDQLFYASHKDQVNAGFKLPKEIKHLD